MVMKGEIDTLLLSSLVSELNAVRREKSKLEKTEKEIMANLKPLIDPEMDKIAKSVAEGEEVSMPFDNLKLVRSEGSRSEVSADLLLAQGVSPEKIAKATKTTTFFQYRIKEVKG